MNLIGVAKSALTNFQRMVRSDVEKGITLDADGENVGSYHVSLTCAETGDMPRQMDRADVTTVTSTLPYGRELDVLSLQHKIVEFVGHALGYAMEASPRAAQTEFHFSAHDDEPGTIYLDIARGRPDQIPFTHLAASLDHLESLMLDDWNEQKGMMVRRYDSPEEQALALDFLAMLCEAFGLEETMYENIFDASSDGRNEIHMNPQFLTLLREREQHIAI